jgi:hypothetical protein
MGCVGWIVAIKADCVYHGTPESMQSLMSKTDRNLSLMNSHNELMNSPNKFDELTLCHFIFLSIGMECVWFCS